MSDQKVMTEINQDNMITDTAQLQKQQNQDCDKQQNDSQQQDQYDHYADDKPLPKAKPMDLKQLWLSQTNKSLQKFNNKFNELKVSQKYLQEGFRKFQENQNKYRLSSLRKIQFKLDHKKLYRQYMQKTRKTIQKINPSLYVNIMSYTHHNLFLAMLKMRRISTIFNQIFINESIQVYLAEKDYLFSQTSQKALKSSILMCKKYVKFYRTFLYYKQMQYSEQIPQNSIMKDFQEAVSFINQIHKLVLQKHSRNFTYYSLMNQFMRKNRVVIGLSSLSLTSLVMVRKPAIIAFSNYLALNQQQRSKQQITKTKYSKVISVVQYQDYRDSLIINTKVSNYLWEEYHLNFAVLVTANIGSVVDVKVQTWNILVYHLHNQQKAIYLKDIQLQQNKYISTRFDIQFSQNMETCRFATIQYLNWVKAEAVCKCMDIITSPIVQNKKEQQKLNKENEEDVEQFSYCYFYRFQQYFIIAIPNKFA